MDYTVSTRSIIANLYHYLPANGSELVLFDINRSTLFGPLMSSASELALQRLLPNAPEHYRLTVVGNVEPASPATQARTLASADQPEQVRPLGIDYPKEIYSLSMWRSPSRWTTPSMAWQHARSSGSNTASTSVVWPCVASAAC